MTGIVLLQIYLIIKKDKRQKLIETVFSVEPKGTSLRRLIHPAVSRFVYGTELDIHGLGFYNFSE